MYTHIKLQAIRARPCVQQSNIKATSKRRGCATLPDQAYAVLSCWTKNNSTQIGERQHTAKAHALWGTANGCHFREMAVSACVFGKGEDQLCWVAHRHHSPSFLITAKRPHSSRSAVTAHHAPTTRALA